jgi:hypothetical protein
MINFTESAIEQAAVEWFKELDYSYEFGPEIACHDLECITASLCDTLLPKLMRGEVRVKDMEKQL